MIRDIVERKEKGRRFVSEAQSETLISLSKYTKAGRRFLSPDGVRRHEFFRYRFHLRCTLFLFSVSLRCLVDSKNKDPISLFQFVSSSCL